MVACDVDNPLTGPHGAAAVYGPQKGASPDDVARSTPPWPAGPTLVAVGHRRDRAATTRAPARPAGSASRRWRVLGARLRPGIDLVLDLVGFDRPLAGADLVVTGEGSLDEQTLNGKAPAGVAAARPRRPACRSSRCAGRSLLDDASARRGFAAVYPLIDLEPDPAGGPEAGPLLRSWPVGSPRDHLPSLPSRGRP